MILLILQVQGKFCKRKSRINKIYEGNLAKITKVSNLKFLFHISNII